MHFYVFSIQKKKYNKTVRYVEKDETKELIEDIGMVILAPKEPLKRVFINLKNEITDEWTSMF